jgi:hypothetical protein
MRLTRDPHFVQGFSSQLREHLNTSQMEKTIHRHAFIVYSLTWERERLSRVITIGTDPKIDFHISRIILIIVLMQIAKHLFMIDYLEGCCESKNCIRWSKRNLGPDGK